MHLLVCTRGPWCPQDGDVKAVHAEVEKQIHEHGLFHTVRVNETDCMSQCGHGPVMAVYPEELWYRKLTPEKIREIFREHFVGGKPVGRYLHHKI
jgi:(2Fe-2S) ferredoxin